MNHSPAYILAQHLIAEGLVSSPSESGDWPVYVGHMPDGNNVPHNVVAAIDTTPVKDGRLMRTGENIFHPGVQVAVRSTNFNEGFAKAHAIAKALESVANTSVDVESEAYTLLSITQTTGVVLAGQEEGPKRRELFTVNFVVSIGA